MRITIGILSIAIACAACGSLDAARTEEEQQDVLRQRMLEA
jgi:hypothetical protein